MKNITTYCGINCKSQSLLISISTNLTFLPIACPSRNRTVSKASPWCALRLNNMWWTMHCRSWLVKNVVESSEPTKKCWSSKTNSLLPPPYSGLTGLRMHTSSAPFSKLTKSNIQNQYSKACNQNTFIEWNSIPQVVIFSYKFVGNYTFKKIS